MAEVASASSSENNAARWAGAMPKGIGALEFLEEHPNSDGRGVIIAILDTGVDPGAKGLQLTSDGKPKILDILDCTGSGDVDTSLTVEADGDGNIQGYFDTPLTVNSEWTNPTGKWHIGYKRAFELFPKGLQKRIAAERKKGRDEQQRAVLATAIKEAYTKNVSLSKQDSVTLEERKQLDELEERVKLLKDLEKFEDPGPLLHCVVWNDGEKWRAAIDTSDLYEANSGKSGEGRLADYEPLTDFEIDQRFATFSAEDACNYGVHIYEDGCILSIVVESGSHGTHVAGIAAAHHPDDPTLNGIAPGAQIISCKIGDSRLDGMETNVGLTRGLIDVLHHKADLINLSYGEATATPNQGRFIELASEVVNKHGVIFVSSAGNSGPALSSVGAPGGTSSAIVSVGAFVSPELAAAGHSVRQDLKAGQQYTWSSRGPTPDGHLGVSLSAPGGAIAPVPNWSQQSRQLMNGTSMASPCACGGFALLLSGLKATGQVVTPNRVRRSVENTCLHINPDVDESPLTYGRGLLQVHKAFELLSRTGEVDVPDVRYEVRVKRADMATYSRGIYLREPHDSAQATSHMVEVTPKLKEGADIKEECLEVEDKVLLQCLKSWVSHPQLLLLPYNGRNFEVKVDPTDLPAGVHYTEVIGLDSENEWRGPLFRIPITVIKPEEVPALQDSQGGPLFSSSWSLNCEAGQECRRFLSAPVGSTWAEMRIRANSFDTPKTFMIRASQLRPHTRYSDTEARHTATLCPGAEWVTPFKIIGGSTLEVTVAQFWSSAGSSSLEIEILFHGVVCEPSSLLLDGSSGISKFFVSTPLIREKLAPVAKLQGVQMALRPSDSTISPLAKGRDGLPNEKIIHKLELNYKLKVEETGSYKPSIPMLNKYVYDSVVEAEMYMVYDANKKLLSVGDIYPSEVKLKKGDHTVRLLVRHDSPALLEKLTNLPMIWERKIKDGIPVSIYPTNSSAVCEKDAVKDFIMARGERRALFLGPFSADDKLPKDALPGRILTGMVQLGKASDVAGAKEAPGSIPFTYLVPPKKDLAEGPKATDEEDKKEENQEKLEKTLLNAKIKFLEDRSRTSPADDEFYDKLASELLEADPKLLKVLLWQLNKAKEQYKKNRKSNAAQSDSTLEGLAEVVLAADNVLKAIDQVEVAQYVALENPEEGPGSDARRKLMKDQKEALITALAAKAEALIGSEIAANSNSADSEASVKPENKGEAAFLELRKWVDTTADEYVLLHARRDAAACRYALAIRALQKVLTSQEKPPTKELMDLEVDLLRKLGWHHWERAHRSLIWDSFPPHYHLF